MPFDVPVIIIGMTQLLAYPLSKIRQPRVIAEVIAGIILGPTGMSPRLSLANVYNVFPLISHGPHSQLQQHHLPD